MNGQPEGPGHHRGGRKILDEEKTIRSGLTGTGCFDAVGYEKFHGGPMSDNSPTDEDTV